jgi:hypothetical protein
MGVLAAAQFFVSGSFRAFASASVEESAHVEFLILREFLARDIQHASSLVEQASLDGRVYRTQRGPLADSLVVQLPAMDAGGAALPGVYDFVVYAVADPQQGVASLTRQLFTNRDADGNPLSLLEGSARVPEARTLVKALALPQPDRGVGPLFTPDQPIVALARQVVVEMTVQPAEPSTRRTFPQTYRAQFRLRNT